MNASISGVAVQAAVQRARELGLLDPGGDQAEQEHLMQQVLLAAAGCEQGNHPGAQLVVVRYQEPAVAPVAPDHDGVDLAMAELTDWCTRHFRLIEQGRKLGLRFGASGGVKDAIVLFSTDQEQGRRIVANLLDLPS